LEEEQAAKETSEKNVKKLQSELTEAKELLEEESKASATVTAAKKKLESELEELREQLEDELAAKVGNDRPPFIRR